LSLFFFNDTSTTAISTLSLHDALPIYPSICRAGDDFYLVNSTFEYFPGLPIYHSKDLVHWKLIANALNRPSQLPLKRATDHGGLDRKSTRLNSSHRTISYAVFCLKKKK